MTAHQTDTYHLLGNLLRFLARSGDGAAYTLVEAVTAPGAGAPPNRHPADDEAFYVLDGRFEFTLDGRTVPAGAGDFVQVPKGPRACLQERGRQAGTDADPERARPRP